MRCVYMYVDVLFCNNVFIRKKREKLNYKLFN